MVLWVWLNLTSSSRDPLTDNTVTGTSYIWERPRISKLPPHSPSWTFFRNLCHLSSFRFSTFSTLSMAMSSGSIIPWSWSSGRHKKSLYDTPSGVFGLDSRYSTSCLLSFLGPSGSPWIWLFRMKEWYRQSPSPGTFSTLRSIYFDFFSNASSFFNSSSRLPGFWRIKET